MARLVTDRQGRVSAVFTGACCFEPDGPGLVCHERGVLRHGGGRYASGRTTVWRFPQAGWVEVLFGDGRPFHAFSEEQPEAVHLCDADRYEVAYSFADAFWVSRWVVRGPAKDYVMTTRYRRGRRSANGSPG